MRFQVSRLGAGVSVSESAECLTVSAVQVPHRYGYGLGREVTERARGKEPDLSLRCRWSARVNNPRLCRCRRHNREHGRGVVCCDDLPRQSRGCGLGRSCSCASACGRRSCGRRGAGGRSNDGVERGALCRRGRGDNSGGGGGLSRRHRRSCCCRSGWRGNGERGRCGRCGQRSERLPVREIGKQDVHPGAQLGGVGWGGGEASQVTPRAAACRPLQLSRTCKKSVSTLKHGLTTNSMKPICDLARLCALRSHSGEMGRPSDTSMSPCR